MTASVIRWIDVCLQVRATRITMQTVEIVPTEEDQMTSSGTVFVIRELTASESERKNQSIKNEQKHSQVSFKGLWPWCVTLGTTNISEAASLFVLTRKVKGHMLSFVLYKEPVSVAGYLKI